MCDNSDQCEHKNKTCDELDGDHSGICFRKKKPLILNLKGTYWNNVRLSQKLFEFRVMSSYWKKRLLMPATFNKGEFDGFEVKNFSYIELRLGYPKSGDENRIIQREWRGLHSMQFIHPFFGPDPVEVFAIDVSRKLKL